MIRDEGIANAVKESIGRLGFRSLKVPDVQNELRQMQLPRVPSQSTILCIMKERLHLAFRKQNSQKIRYQDPRLDADRVDIVRIITTLLEQNALVVTIDEASFNHTLNKHSQWQLKPQAIKQLNAVHDEPQTGARRPRGPFLPV